MKKAPKDRTARPKAKATRPPVYANAALVEVGPFEIQFRLSHMIITGLEPLSGDTVEVGRVAMPVQSAKALAFGLLCAIASHEALMGHTDVLPALAPPMPSSQTLGPNVVARLAQIHAELFAPVPTPAAPAQQPDPGVNEQASKPIIH